MKEIKVLKFEVGKECYESIISDSLESIQEFVGGYFETLPIDNRYLLIVNEEGKIKKLKNNLCLVNLHSITIKEVIVGNCFITKRRGENFSSLSKQDIKELKQRIQFDTETDLSLLFI